MSIESTGALSDLEKKNKSDTEKKQEIAKELQFSKEKKELFARIENKKELAYLKSLVERGLLDVHSAELIADSEGLETTEVEKIFEKIDEIERIEAIEKILPESLRITKDEYIKALTDTHSRQAALTKIDNALTYLYDQTHPDGFAAINVFFSGFMMLGKNLVLVQENTIDIKRNLQKRDSTVQL